MRMKDKLSELEISQMNVINKLQEKIKLLEFEIGEFKKENRILKEKLIDKRKVIKDVIKQIKNIKEQEEYNKLSNVLMALNSSLRERQ